MLFVKEICVVSVANILTLLTILGGVVASAWTVYSALAQKIDGIVKDHQDKIDAIVKDNDTKIKRVYQRQDEELKLVYDSQKDNITKIEKEFMRVDAHNLSMDHIKEVMEIKSNATIQLFTTRLDNLANNVKELIDRVNSKETNR